MKPPKKIASKNLPFRSPLVFTAVAWLVLDRLDAPQFAWSVVGTIVVITWIGFLVDLFAAESVDIFHDKRDGGK